MSLKLAPIFASVSAIALTAGCSSYNQGADVTSTPDPIADASNQDYSPEIPKGTGYFASDSTLPFLAPDFTRISEDDYVPAFEQGMAIQKAEVQAIIDNPAAPDFENTIVALETSGRMLGRVSRVFFQLTGTNTNDRLDEINTEISPKLSAHGDSITLNPDLFARVKSIYDRRASMTMTVEDAKLLEETYASMVHAGALLTEAQREEVKAINTQLSTLTTEFGQLARDAMADQPLVVDTREELAGLSDAEIDAAAAFATEKGFPGKFAIALQNTTQQPLLPTLENRATREALFKLSHDRADGKRAVDTRDLIARIALLRAEKAALFGQPDWASYTMYDRMAKEPKTALDFMEQMVPALAATQRREAEMLNAAIRADGGDFSVQPWDWYRYANRIKAEQYDLDEDAVMEYFVLENVLEDGIFHMAEELYGLTFERRTDLPVYHPDVWVYTVFEADGSELG
ncbi:MAG: M3 family metallopeptidase, partial [Myxococcota bacterium]